MLVTTIDPVIVQQKTQPLASICEEDRQEQAFDRLVKLWVDDEITYDHLLRNYPEYELSMFERLMRFVLDKID